MNTKAESMSPFYEIGGVLNKTILCNKKICDTVYEKKISNYFGGDKFDSRHYHNDFSIKVDLNKLVGCRR